MNWKENICQCQRLPAEETLRRRWQVIPQDVEQTMAFEREPVELRFLQEILDQQADAKARLKAAQEDLEAKLDAKYPRAHRGRNQDPRGGRQMAGHAGRCRAERA